MAVRNANILAARGELFSFRLLYVSITNIMQLLPMLSERYLSIITPQKYLISNSTQSLGPRGMDKMVCRATSFRSISNISNNSSDPKWKRQHDHCVYTSSVSSDHILTTQTNDGNTMLKSMSVMHPAAKMLVDLSAAQDIEAGDGTTSVVVIAGSLLGAADRLLSKGKLSES